MDNIAVFVQGESAKIFESSNTDKGYYGETYNKIINSGMSINECFYLQSRIDMDYI